MPIWTEYEREVNVMSSVASYYRALFHYAEATLVYNKKFLIPTLSALYYGYFHLGTSHLLAEANPPPKLGTDSKWVERVRREIERKEDPARAIDHSCVRLYLRACSEANRLVGLSDALSALWDIRNDLHYGPRLREKPEHFEFDSCRNPVTKVRAIVRTHLRQGPNYFVEFYDSCDLLACNLFGYPKHEDLLLNDHSGLYPYFGTEARREAATLHAQLKEHLKARMASPPTTT